MAGGICAAGQTVYPGNVWGFSSNNVNFHYDNTYLQTCHIANIPHIWELLVKNLLHHLDEKETQLY